MQCYDKYGELINYLTQWDANITLYIYNYEFGNNIPIFHFYNSSTYKNNSITQIGELHTDVITSKKYVTVQIPNIFLKCAETLYVCMYIIDGTNGRTEDKATIPIRKKPKPEDYTYISNNKDLVFSALKGIVTPDNITSDFINSNTKEEGLYLLNGFESGDYASFNNYTIWYYPNASDSSEKFSEPLFPLQTTYNYQPKNIYLNNTPVTVQKADWVEEDVASFDTHPYRYDINLQGVAPTDYADVIFDETTDKTGKVFNKSVTGTNKVSIYAKEPVVAIILTLRVEVIR